MSLILLDEISKVYHQPIKENGVTGAIKHLFLPRYIDKIAVDKLSLSVNKGESLAFLGSNGAGKSTVIKMMTGVLVPTSGNIYINGFVPHKSRIKYTKFIGAVFGQRTQLWWDIPIIESFEMLKEIYEIPPDIYKENMKKFEKLLDLKTFIHLSARRLSLGQRIRADLAAAFLHNPQIVFLDEPTIGLDIEVKQRVRAFIKQLNEEKETTIILTTHDLDDIDNICSRLLVIDEGAILYDGGLLKAKDTFARERILHIELEKTIMFDSISMNISFTQVEKVGDKKYILTFDRFQYTANQIVSAFMKVGTVIDFYIEEPGINQVIKNISKSSVKKI